MSAVLAAVGLLLTGCSTGPGGAVDEATNEAQERRLIDYEYAESEEGKSARWVDQKNCVTGVSVLIGFGAAEYSLSVEQGFEPTGAKNVIEEAEAVGDETTVAALKDAKAELDTLINDPSRTVREAVTSSMALCESDELDPGEVADSVESAIERAVSDTKGKTVRWEGPDGTRFVPSTRQSTPSAQHQCSDEIAAKLVDYASNGIGLDKALASFDPAARDYLNELFLRAEEAVSVGTHTPSEVPTLMGNLNYSQFCQ